MAAVLLALCVVALLWLLPSRGPETIPAAPPQNYYEAVLGDPPALIGFGDRDIERSAGFQFHVVCRMSDGSPVPHAAVRIWRKNYPHDAEFPRRLMGTWKADDQGRVTTYIDTSDIEERRSYGCTFMAIHPTIRGLLAHRRAGIRPNLWGAVDWERAFELRFELTEPGLEGLVTDTDDRPIPDAVVDWTAEGGEGLARLRNRSASDGRFGIARHPILRHLRIQSRDHHPKVVAVAVAQAFVRVRLEPRPVIVGRIVDERGGVVRAAEVEAIMHGSGVEGATPMGNRNRWDHWLSRQGYAESGPRDEDTRTWAFNKTVRTDAEGRFGVPFGTRGTARIVVKAAGFEVLVLDRSSVEARADFGDVVLRPSSLVGAYGTLRTKDGVPIPGAKVRFTRPPLDETQVHLATRETDEQGRFPLDELPEDELVVVALSPPPSFGRGNYMQRVTIRRGMELEY